MKCPQCQNTSPPSAKFCSECGTRLRPEAQVATVHRSVGASLAPEIAVHPEDQNRPLTILFADMSGSVARTYDLDPEDTAALLNEILKIMVDAVHRHGGRINSFLG